MKTPLNSIITMGDALEPFIADDKGKKMLKIIGSSSRLLFSLVNDLLDFF